MCFRDRGNECHYTNNHYNEPRNIYKQTIRTCLDIVDRDFNKNINSYFKKSNSKFDREGGGWRTRLFSNFWVLIKNAHNLQEMLVFLSKYNLFLRNCVNYINWNWKLLLLKYMTARIFFLYKNTVWTVLLILPCSQVGHCVFPRCAHATENTAAIKPWQKSDTAKLAHCHSGFLQLYNRLMSLKSLIKHIFKNIFLDIN